MRWQRICIDGVVGGQFSCAERESWARVVIFNCEEGGGGTGRVKQSEEGRAGG